MTSESVKCRKKGVACRFSVVDIGFLAILSAVFFALPVFLAPDSATYIVNAQVLEGTLPTDKWISLRGPLLPFLLRLSFGLFGESAYGTAVLLYVFYLLLIALTLYACHLLGLVEKLGKLWCWVLCSILLFLNPTVLTYAHHVLTEFFALVLGMAALCLVLKTQQLLLMVGGRRVVVQMVRYVGIAALVVALYALKQMFFALALVLFVLSELYMLFRRYGVRQLVVSILAVVLVTASVPAWDTTWAHSVDGWADPGETYSTQGLATSTLIDGLRYFRPEERGTTGSPVRIDVMADGYSAVESSFTYTFKGSLWDSLRYLGTCFMHSPERFVSSWMHNYFVIANVRRVMDYENSRAYSPVTITNYFWQSFETQGWLERYKALGERGTGYNDDWADGFIQFQQPVDDGLVSNLLFNTGYPVFAYFIYSLTAFCAPWVMLAAIAMCILRRKNKQKTAYWGNVMLLSGGVFGYIAFLAVSAGNIDRYGFPATGMCALLLLLTAGNVAHGLWHVAILAPLRKWRHDRQINRWYDKTVGSK